MSRISMASIEQPKILDVLSDYGINTTQIGSKYFTNCLFHNGDNTPSLAIYPDTNSFYCFACHTYGTVENLIAKLENKTYYEVCNMLYGDKYNFRKLGNKNKEIEPDSKYMLDILSKELYNKVRNKKIDLNKVPEIINKFTTKNLKVDRFKQLLRDIREL